MSTSAETAGGYARQQTDDEHTRTVRTIAGHITGVDLVITTANIPGRKSPVLITEEGVASMRPGSVIVDLAAENGGNCALTKADETVHAHGVTILGPTNLPATVPYHASQMYAKNITTFLAHLVKDGAVRIDQNDEITRETLVTHGGAVVNPRIRELVKSEV